jgi:hypothetical protein
MSLFVDQRPACGGLRRRFAYLVGHHRHCGMGRLEVADVYDGGDKFRVQLLEGLQ